jgi:hypothetical protein
VQSGRRCFATGNRLQASYGFIGLGRMGEYPFTIQGSSYKAVADDLFPGYPMAKNLREKVAKDDRITIFDVNNAATQKFVEEVGGNVTIAKTVREVAEQTVRFTLS